MSAAESAHPGPDGPGTVILFRQGPSKRRRRRREETVPNQREPRDPSASPHQRLADTVETMFLKCNRTLTDPETREVYLITLDLVANLLGGARVNGVVDEEAGLELHAMVDGMKAAPDLL